jgi:hypothetical protein
MLRDICEEIVESVVGGGGTISALNICINLKNPYTCWKLVGSHIITEFFQLN